MSPSSEETTKTSPLPSAAAVTHWAPPAEKIDAVYGSVATGSFAPVVTSCEARRHGSDVVCGSMPVLSRVMNEKTEPESVLLPSENEWFGHSSPTGVTSPVAPSIAITETFDCGVGK